MGTGDILLGGNPVMDQHPVLSMPYAKKTGMRSGRLGLWLMSAFTFLLRVSRLLCIELCIKPKILLLNFVNMYRL